MDIHEALAIVASNFARAGSRNPDMRIYIETVDRGQTKVPAGDWKRSNETGSTMTTTKLHSSKNI